jgi:hypothetical protein
MGTQMHNRREKIWMSRSLALITPYWLSFGSRFCQWLPIIPWVAQSGLILAASATFA